MSWFSNRFSAPFGSSSEGLHNDSSGSDEEEDQALVEKGVKDDLSELTKTFTRQLWGVASFLAPPPQTKNDEEEQRSFDEEDDDEASRSNPHSERGTQAQIKDPSNVVNEAWNDPSIVEASLTELVDVDFHGTLNPSEDNTNVEGRVDEAYNNENQSATVSTLNNEHRFTGISKDLAELKGSVATGISKFLRVVRDEIDRDDEDRTRHREDNNGDEEDNNINEPESSGDHVRRIPRLDSLFRPFISSILPNDHSEGMILDSSSVEDDDREYDDGDYDGEDDPSDMQGHEFSRPKQSVNVHRTSQLSGGLASITKLASNLFPVSLDSDDESETLQQKKIREAVGVTDEVLAFARNISMHPETWLDFPLFTDDEDDDDFEMSDAQKEHVYQVELASPRLAALRIELCPDYMTESRFWKIYFVLLHSRLSKTDAVLLSTPQIMEARALLLKKLQKDVSQESTNAKVAQDSVEGKTPMGVAESFKIVSLKSAMAVPAKDFGQIDYLDSNVGGPQKSGQSSDSGEEVQNKTVLASTLKLAALSYDEEEADADRWLDEEPSPHIGTGAAGLANEDDVSFSDLEEDDEPMSKTVASEKRSHSWVQLNKSDEMSGKVMPDETGHAEAGGSKVKEYVSSQGNAVREHNRGESSDWSTVEEDEVDFV